MIGVMAAAAGARAEPAGAAPGAAHAGALAPRALPGRPLGAGVHLLESLHSCLFIQHYTISAKVPLVV